MKTIVPSRLLRNAFLADAAASGAIAALHLFISGERTGPVAATLGLPAPLLEGTGIFLALYALLLVVLARSRVVWSALAWFIVLGNVGWAALSGLLLATGGLAPAPLGGAYVVVQALGVLLFAGLEWRGVQVSLPGARVTAQAGKDLARGHAG
ncbi:hypothetical protein E7V67_005485 [[Empedobacter] haloabium]|uniref:Uncharacterized protein n=1 Tax=[Empedobacter] haloabium TaxID=592317 RepID=A0ABZ1UPG6_9BURK